MRRGFLHVWSLSKMCVCVCVCALVLASERAHADVPTWNEAWPRFRTSEHVATGAMGLGVLTLYLVPRVTPRWGGGLLFDEDMRLALRAASHSDRQLATRLSNVGYWGMLIEPIVFQGALVPLILGSPDVAAQITLINLQSFAFTAFVFRASEAIVARARPHVWDCVERDGTLSTCRERGLGGTNSFPSGHAAIAATGATLICVQQAHVQLYGKIGGAVSCAAAIGLALTAGIGRVVGDLHYTTDVLAGWLLGVFSGWALPSLLHYGFDGEGVGDARATAKQPVTFAWTSAF